MSYTALYRKFRPDNFDDVKGQDHIVTTLTNQIKHNRIGHAYLFCGTRGTGKTTAVSYTHLRAHETGRNLVCRLLLEKKKKRLCQDTILEIYSKLGKEMVISNWI